MPPHGAASGGLESPRPQKPTERGPFGRFRQSLLNTHSNRETLVETPFFAAQN